MANEVYGGSIPNSCFTFDRIYNNATEAQAGAASDGILLGRYILIMYCDTAFNHDQRNALEGEVSTSYVIVTPENTDEKKYKNNFFKDGRISKDRKVYRKEYRDGEYQYIEVASLHSDLSDDSIKVKAIASGDKILKLDNDINRMLSSTLSLWYDEQNKQLRLDGHSNQTINKFSTSNMFKDRIYSDDNVLIYDESTGVLKTNLTLNYNTDNQYIELKTGDKLVTSFDASDFVKDSFLRDVQYNGNNELIFTFTTYDITKKEYNDKSVKVTLDIMDAGNGIEIVDSNGIAVKLDSTAADKYLKVDSAGLRTEGISAQFTEINNRLDIIQGDANVEGSIANSIKTALTWYDFGGSES